MLLSRIAAPSQTRAFSTSLALRFNASKIAFEGGRTNPLVGNYIPPAPEPKPTPKPAPQPAVNESSELKTAESKTDFVPPPPPPPPPPAESSSSSQTTPQKSSSSDAGFSYSATDANSPLNVDITALISSKSAAYGQSLGIGDPLQRPRIRAKAVTGRTVFIKDRLTPTSAPTPAVAIRVLERMCREQKVKNKYHSQKFHERKGLKKKRLRSQRWKARFKFGFKAAVSKVMELKKQGW